MADYDWFDYDDEPVRPVESAPLSRVEALERRVKALEDKLPKIVGARKQAAFTKMAEVDLEDALDKIEKLEKEKLELLKLIEKLRAAGEEMAEVLRNLNVST